jgi:hypothetical protein
MRTTVTLDSDVEQILKKAARKRGESFKVVLNDAVRQAFKSKPATAKRKAFVVQASSMGAQPGIDPTRLSELTDEMEIDAHLKITKRLQEKLR